MTTAGRAGRNRVRNDRIIASGVGLEDGSGFSTDPIACHDKRTD